MKVVAVCRHQPYVASAFAGLTRARYHCVAVAALVVCAAGLAHADGKNARLDKMAREHYRLGVAAFTEGRYEQAITELKRAYLIEPIPELLVNIGKTYEKLEDVNHAIYYYREYLTKSPPDAPHRDEIERRLDELEGRGARRQPPRAPPPADEPPPREAEPPPREAEPPPPPPPASRAPMPTKWSHTPIDAAPPSQPLDVRVQTPPMKGVQVFLFYRSPGEADFTPVRMRRLGPEMVGRIPAEALSGKTVQYYIEARRKNGVVAQHAGSAAEPNLVMIDPSAAPRIAGDAAAGEATADEGDAEAAAPPPEETPRSARRDLDQEQAPLRAEGAAAPASSRSGREGAKEGKSGASRPLRWAGVALLAAGAVIAAVGGGVGFAYGFRYAQGVASDAEHSPLYVFDDPMAASSNDKSFQDKSHLFDTIGIASIAAGGALVATGLTLVIVDAVRHASPAKPAKRRRPARVPASSESSLLRDPIIAPTMGARQAGLTIQLSF
jgi:tetratricopeptide (TPR) repeat protein